MKYNYSIIIPHKEIPDLLMRCIKSIPDRDDVQIIVVDDNSKDSESYLYKYPELSRPNLELYLTKEGKGAGYARNVGLDHAKGRWLLFADADDFFSESFNNILDTYKDDDSEVIYFDFDAVLSNDLTVKSNRSEFVKITAFKGENNIEDVRFLHVIPWAKIIQRKLVIENNIRFQEIRWSNDVYFSTKVGVIAKKIKISEEKLYIVTEREGSLVFHKDRSTEELICRTKAGIDALEIARKYKYEGSTVFCAGWMAELYKTGEYVLFVRALHSLKISDLKSVYNNAIWGLGRLNKIFLVFLLFISIIIPFRDVNKCNSNKNI